MSPQLPGAGSSAFIFLRLTVVWSHSSCEKERACSVYSALYSRFPSKKKFVNNANLLQRKEPTEHGGSDRRCRRRLQVVRAIPRDGIPSIPGGSAFELAFHAEGAPGGSAFSRRAPFGGARAGDRTIRRPNLKSGVKLSPYQASRQTPGAVVPTGRYPPSSLAASQPNRLFAASLPRAPGKKKTVQEVGDHTRAM